MKLTICGLWELEAALKTSPDAVVSIRNPGERVAELEALTLPRLTLVFHDAWGDDEGDFHLPQAWHFRKLWAFLRETRPHHLLLHCAAGVSRSPGMALAALVWEGTLGDAELVAQVVQAQPIACPNPRIVRLLDELTGRNVQGALQIALPGWLPEVPPPG